MHLSYEFALLSLAAWFVGLSKGGLPTIGMLAVPILSLMGGDHQGLATELPYGSLQCCKDLCHMFGVDPWHVG